MALNATPTYSISPSAKKVPTKTNYISLFDYTSQYKPEEHEEMANIFGNKSITGMLYMLGAESAMASDKFIWTEEGRLHVIYRTVTRTNNVFTQGMKGTLSTDFTILENKPIIQKDNFEVNGSDMAQISWVKTDEGRYLWFMKDQMNTRRRFEDRTELSLINGQKAETGTAAEANGTTGTEGLLEAIRERGNTFQGVANAIEDFDDIVKRFDAQGKIQDYMFYVDRDQSLAIDNMLGQLNAGYDGGVSYGIFDNDKDMAVNLGFKGFTRGTYNFHKTDYKLLNEVTLLGGEPVESKVRGLLIPVGTKEVYEGQYNGNGAGEKITTPFLQCMYRANSMVNRKYENWVTGSVFGVKTDDEDVMREHQRSERMLNTVGANNFMLFEGTE